MTRAANGDKQAWDALVERCAPLIWSICRRYQLSSADATGIGQAIWLQFMEQLGKVRDPAALTGWLATTTQRECGKTRRTAHRPQGGREGAGRRDHPG
jgi:DNA-directed RNA polymerase specialized sigma24 family protein